jgi:L-ascorbate metabolism protein UlaG (beta-lactamase superfamily)
LTDAHAIRYDSGISQIKLTYIGGPTLLIETGGWRILTDPTFDPPGRRYFFGWGTYSRKLHGPAVSFEQLGPIDAVLLSHDHHDDNLDPTARELLPQMGQIITTVPGGQRLGGTSRGLAPWDTMTLMAPGKTPIAITATPCRHGPPGSKPIVGEVIGFSLRWEGQEHGTLWISGDTVLYPAVRRVAERINVGTAVMHVGGVRFPWLSGPARYTMTAKDAVELCTALNPATIIPVHAEGWRHFVEPRSEAEKVFAQSPLAACTLWLPAGQAITVDA